MTGDHLAWLKTLQNPLLWWMINVRLEILNQNEIDTALLDRTMEYGEALGALSRHSGIITHAGIDETDYMAEEYKVYLRENNSTS